MLANDCKSWQLRSMVFHASSTDAAEISIVVLILRLHARHVVASCLRARVRRGRRDVPVCDEGEVMEVWAWESAHGCSEQPRLRRL